MGIPSNKTADFDNSIRELMQEQLISVEKGFLCVRGNEKIISNQSEKENYSDQLIQKGDKFLKRLSKLPFIRYIGISGSVAARNPTLQYTKDGKSYVDLDLFVITKSNCIWPLFLIERVLTNFQKLFKGYHFYCFNYVTDESFLKVYNKNFYTATELTNLTPIYDDGVSARFFQENQWSKKYYPEYVDERSEKDSKPFWTWIIAPFNFLCFALFCIGRGIKRVELDPFFEMFGGFNPVQKCNLKRISNPNGGYQEAIKNKFTEVFKDRFPKYYTEEIMNDLFPSVTAFTFNPEQDVHDKENAELFSKYALSANEENSI